MVAADGRSTWSLDGLDTDVTAALKIALAICWVAVGALTVRKLFRPPSNARDRFVLGYGVKRLGIGTWLIFSAFAPILVPEFGDVGYLRNVAGLAFFGFPLWLWAGWCAAHATAVILGITPDRR